MVTLVYRPYTRTYHGGRFSVDDAGQVRLLAEAGVDLLGLDLDLGLI